MPAFSQVPLQDVHHRVNALFGPKPPSIRAPPQLVPKPVPIDGTGYTTFYKLDSDNTTGVLAMGSFAWDTLDAFIVNTLDGLQFLKKDDLRSSLSISCVFRRLSPSAF